MIDNLESEVGNVRKDNSKNSYLSEPFYEQSTFKENDDKVVIFTGLPTYSVFKSLLDYLGPYLPKKKDKSQFFFFNLRRLRFNISTELWHICLIGHILLPLS